MGWGGGEGGREGIGKGETEVTATTCYNGISSLSHGRSRRKFSVARSRIDGV